MGNRGGIAREAKRRATSQLSQRVFPSTCEPKTTEVGTLSQGENEEQRDEYTLMISRPELSYQKDRNRSKHSRERKISPSRKLFSVETWAGDGTIVSREGVGKQCGINWPYEIKFDAEGNGIFTAYGSASVRKISPDGKVTTIIEKTNNGEPFHCVRGLALDKAGNIYIADTGNNTVRKIYPNGTCETVSSDATFSAPYGVAVADDGTVYVSDNYSDCIKMIRNGKCEVIAGRVGGFADGVGQDAKFSSPQGIDLDLDGNIIVADSKNNAIRRVDQKTFAVTTVAEGFQSPYGVAIDKKGNIFVADYGNNAIKRIDTKGVVRDIVSSYVSNFVNEPRSLCLPTGIGIDHKGNLVICDCYHHVIRKVNCILDVIAENWPYSMTQSLPSVIENSIVELFSVLYYYPPVSMPKDIMILVIRCVIENWPI
jgi:DNA-binding beta-propeller fold protein YncE